MWFVGFGLQICGEETLAQPPTRGSLLIARESLSDPRFSETVVLILQHDTGGSLGIMLNRPTWVAPTTAFPELDFLDDYEGHIYIGGPLQRSNILILAKGVGNLEAGVARCRDAGRAVSRSCRSGAWRFGRRSIDLFWRYGAV